MSEKKPSTFRTDPDLADAFKVTASRVKRAVRAPSYGDVLGAALCMFMAQDEEVQIDAVQAFLRRAQNLGTEERAWVELGQSVLDATAASTASPPNRRPRKKAGA